MAFRGSADARKSAADVHKHEKNMHKGEPLTKLAKGGFIAKAIKKPGALRASLGAKKGKPIPAAKLAKAAKAPGKLGQRARFAEVLKGFKHKGKSKFAEGGSVPDRKPAVSHAPGPATKEDDVIKPGGVPGLIARRSLEQAHDKASEIAEKTSKKTERSTGLGLKKGGKVKRRKKYI